MKSRFAKLAAAAAVSLAFTAPASAVIGVGDNAGLFLEVYDIAGNSSYVRDLGISINAFGTQNRPTGGFANIRDDQVSDAFSSTAGATWASFLATVSAPSNLRWDVMAIDGFGTSAPDQLRRIFTSTADVVAALAPAGSQQNNSGVTNMNVVETAHVPGLNALLGAGTEAFTTDPTNPGNYNQGKGPNLAGGLGVAIGTTTAALGQSMGFYYMTRSGSVPSAEGLVAAYKLATGEAWQWNLDPNGTLTYSVNVAAIPEPTTWALFAAGALMLGGIARRRLS